MTNRPPASVFTAPLPVPRSFTLLDAATVVTTVDGRIGAGANIDDYPRAQPSIQEAFASGSARVKAIDGDFTTEAVEGFTAYLGVTCDSAGVVPREAEFRRRLQAAFRAVESAAVEQILVDAGGLMVTPYLTDTKLEVLGGGAVGAQAALELLENAIASVGNGMIHVTPATNTALRAKNLVEEYRDGQMRTKANGTLVAVGAGYIGAYPQGGSPASGDQEWAFASGFVEVHRDEDTILGPIREALDRTTNDVTFIAERNYLVAWVGRQASDDTNHIQAGVLVDRSA